MEFNAKAQVMNNITKQNEKITKARRLLLEEDIEPADYKEIKAVCDALIAHLEVKLQEASETKMIRLDINKLTARIISTFCNLDKIFEKALLKKQRHILCSLFPEKIDFDGAKHRTLRTNSIAHVIFLINRELKGLKQIQRLIFRRCIVKWSRRESSPLHKKATNPNKLEILSINKSISTSGILKSISYLALL